MRYYIQEKINVLWEKKKLLETSNFFIYNSTLYQKGSFFKLDSLELLPTTSLDLDQSRIPPFENEILVLYCGNK